MVVGNTVKKNKASESSQKRQKVLVAVYKKYLDWMMSPDICKQQYSFEELCKQADCTQEDIEFVEWDCSLKEAMDDLKRDVEINNSFILLNKCYDAVDRILSDRRAVEDTEQYDFHEKNVIKEAGLSFADVFSFKPSSAYRISLNAFGELLTLKSLSCERYLMNQDENELKKVEFIKALCRIKNHETIHTDPNQPKLRYATQDILKEANIENIYLPPKHNSMINNGVMSINHLIFNMNVYAMYLKHLAEHPQSKPIVSDIVGEDEKFYRLTWLEVMIEMQA